MSEIQPSAGQDHVDSLFIRIALLVDQTQAIFAAKANVALTLMYWEIGHLIDVEVLRHQRADYDQKIVASLGPQLTERYGSGFNNSSLHRMVKFAQTWPDREIVVSLGRQLSWTHFKAILPVRDPEARDFYIEQAITARLSVRALRDLIGRQGFERNEIANAQTPGGSMVPSDSFRDPYFLDFLGLKDASEPQSCCDLHNVSTLSVPRISDRRGQMKLYLKWLDRYERRDGEDPPIGLLPCTETSREQIELLEMHKDGIVVAEHWTALPPMAELQARIQQIYRAASERVARTVTKEQED